MKKPQSASVCWIWCVLDTVADGYLLVAEFLHEHWKTPQYVPDVIPEEQPGVKEFSRRLSKIFLGAACC